jgi:hypothetical protein
MKNRLIVIGWLGIKTCYLNVDREEAIRRWCKQEGISVINEFEHRLLQQFEFDDEFGAYDAWDLP